MTFTNLFISVEREVQQLINQNVNKIILLGHADYETDKMLAEMEGVDVVVCGQPEDSLHAGLSLFS